LAQEAWGRSIARDTKLNHDVAIKVLPESVARDPDHLVVENLPAAYAAGAALRCRSSFQEVNMAHDPSAVNTHTRPDREGMTRDEILALFDRRQKAYDDLDATRLAADYTPNAGVQSPMGGTHQGRAAIETVFQAFFDAFVDLRVTTDRLVIDGNSVVQILNVEGTHIGVFLGLEPTGKPFRFTAAVLYDVQDGQIVRERRIYDFTGLLVQIGGLRAKPV
jgi:predicted ester cyclase